MRVQLEQNVRVDRLTGNTEQFSKIVPMNFSINQPITVSTETRKNSLHEWHWRVIMAFIKKGKGYEICHAG